MQRAPKFSPQQRVEVLVTDFATPGFPKIWKPATVTAIAAFGDGNHDVSITCDDGTFAHQVVGPRGGNARVRVATPTPK